MIERHALGRDEDLAATVLRGQVVLVRGGLQAAGLMEPLVQASLEGIRRSAGREVAHRVAADGFERIHEHVSPQSIPAVTDAVYATVTDLAPGFLARLVPSVFPGREPYYFESSPNVRFHIPYDLAAPHRRQYDQFARKHGQGKIAPHGPHRDSWLDCADNAINVWVAVGPVTRGNGLSIFEDCYDDSFAFGRKGELREGHRLKPPVNFEMAPGDMILFHSDQLHASELNRTDATRYVVSFRITFGKPHFPHGHYHHYRHGALATGGLAWLSGVPATLQWSWVAFRVRWLARRLGLSNGAADGDEAASSPGAGAGAARNDRPADAADAVAGGANGGSAAGASADEAPAIGTVRALDAATCLVRADEGPPVVVSRRCPHQGADLAQGFVTDGHLVCPWHNLPFDLATGRSPCQAIRPLKRTTWPS